MSVLCPTDSNANLLHRVVMNVEFEEIVPTVMPQLHQVLILGLRSHEESSVCLTAVGVVGDVCRAIGEGIVQYSGDLIGAMMYSLQIPTLNKQAKCACIAAFGDIALALGGKIDHFLQFICPVLQDASQTTVDTVRIPSTVE